MNRMINDDNSIDNSYHDYDGDNNTNNDDDDDDDDDDNDGMTDYNINVDDNDFLSFDITMRIINNYNNVDD